MNNVKSLKYAIRVVQSHEPYQKAEGAELNRRVDRTGVFAFQDTGGPKQSQTGMHPRVPAAQSIHQRAQHLQRSFRKSFWHFATRFGVSTRFMAATCWVLFLLLVCFNCIHVFPLVQLSRRIEIRRCFLQGSRLQDDQQGQGVHGPEKGRRWFNARCL